MCWYIKNSFPLLKVTRGSFIPFELFLIYQHIFIYSLTFPNIIVFCYHFYSFSKKYSKSQQAMMLKTRTFSIRLPQYSDKMDDQYEVTMDGIKREKIMDALLKDQYIIVLSRKIMVPQAKKSIHVQNFKLSEFWKRTKKIILRIFRNFICKTCIQSQEF